jgi:hypothetical protein
MFAENRRAGKSVAPVGKWGRMWEGIEARQRADQTGADGVGRIRCRLPEWNGSVSVSSECDCAQVDRQIGGKKLCILVVWSNV